MTTCHIPIPPCSILMFLLSWTTTSEWQIDTVFNLQEWLGHSSSSLPLLADGSAEQSLLPFQPSPQRQEGPSQESQGGPSQEIQGGPSQHSQDGPSESHTSAATHSLQREDSSSSSPLDAGLYHAVVLSFGVSF